MSGSFPADSCVVIVDARAREVARGGPNQWLLRCLLLTVGCVLVAGVVNYSSAEIELIRNHSSREFERILGYAGSDEVISRENLAVTSQQPRPVVVTRESRQNSSDSPPLDDSPNL